MDEYRTASNGQRIVTDVYRPTGDKQCTLMDEYRPTSDGQRNVFDEFTPSTDRKFPNTDLNFPDRKVLHSILACLVLISPSCHNQNAHEQKSIARRP